MKNGTEIPRWVAEQLRCRNLASRGGREHRRWLSVVLTIEDEIRGYVVTAGKVIVGEPHEKQPLRYFAFDNFDDAVDFYREEP